LISPCSHTSGLSPLPTRRVYARSDILSGEGFAPSCRRLIRVTPARPEPYPHRRPPRDRSRRDPQASTPGDRGGRLDRTATPEEEHAGGTLLKPVGWRRGGRSPPSPDDAVSEDLLAWVHIVDLPPLGRYDLEQSTLVLHRRSHCPRRAGIEKLGVSPECVRSQPNL